MLRVIKYNRQKNSQMLIITQQVIRSDGISIILLVKTTMLVCPFSAIIQLISECLTIAGNSVIRHFKLRSSFSIY